MLRLIILCPLVLRFSYCDGVRNVCLRSRPIGAHVGGKDDGQEGRKEEAMIYTRIAFYMGQFESGFRRRPHNVKITDLGRTTQ